MLTKDFKDTLLEKVNTDGASKVGIRWLIGKDNKNANFYMRVLEVEPMGHTPFHNHDWEHEIFVLEGEGILKTESSEEPLEYGRFAFVPAGENHQFKNTSEHKVLKFICLIPK